MSKGRSSERQVSFNQVQRSTTISKRTRTTNKIGQHSFKMNNINTRWLLLLLASSSLGLFATLGLGEEVNDVVIGREGSDLDLSCPIEESPSASSSSLSSTLASDDMIISWTCDDEPPNIRTSRIHVTESGKLRIRNAKVGDSCNYRCEAAQGFGTVSVIIKVLIVDRKYVERMHREHRDHHQQQRLQQQQQQVGSGKSLGAGNSSASAGGSSSSGGHSLSAANQSKAGLILAGNSLENFPNYHHQQEQQRQHELKQSVSSVATNVLKMSPPSQQDSNSANDDRVAYSVGKPQMELHTSSNSRANLPTTTTINRASNNNNNKQPSDPIGRARATFRDSAAPSDKGANSRQQAGQQATLSHLDASSTTASEAANDSSDDMEIQIEPSELFIERDRTFNLECRVKHPLDIRMAPQILWLKEFIGHKPSSIKEAHEQSLLLIDNVYYHTLNWPKGITYDKRITSSSSALHVRHASHVHSGSYICFAGFPPTLMMGASLNLTAASSKSVRGPRSHSIMRYKMAKSIVLVDDAPSKQAGLAGAGVAGFLHNWFWQNAWMRSATIVLMVCCSVWLLITLISYVNVNYAKQIALSDNKKIDREGGNSRSQVSWTSQANGFVLHQVGRLRSKFTSQQQQESRHDNSADPIRLNAALSSVITSSTQLEFPQIGDNFAGASRLLPITPNNQMTSEHIPFQQYAQQSRDSMGDDHYYSQIGLGAGQAQQKYNNRGNTISTTTTTTTNANGGDDVFFNISLDDLSRPSNEDQNKTSSNNN